MRDRVSLPKPVRCTCNKVLPHEAHARNLRDNFTPVDSFQQLGIERICCRVRLTTARETIVYDEEPPSFVVPVPPTNEPRAPINAK